MVYLSLLVLPMAFVAVLGQQCHYGWHYHEGSCYGFGDDTVTWGDAQVVCTTYGATLAEIGSVEENNYLKNIATGKAGAYYWLGGADFFHEGDWEWVSTGETLYPFTDWAPGQPEPAAMGQDCLCMDKSDAYQWHDGDCESQFDFICEANPLETVIG